MEPCGTGSKENRLALSLGPYCPNKRPRATWAGLLKPAGDLERSMTPPHQLATERRT